MEETVGDGTELTDSSEDLTLPSTPPPGRPHPTQSHHSFAFCMATRVCLSVWCLVVIDLLPARHPRAPPDQHEVKKPCQER